GPPATARIDRTEVAPSPSPVRPERGPQGPESKDAPGAFAWTPTVDDDMVDLFFDEAHERIEALSGKLLDIERRPGDGELLRDVFRDLHTVKGSSAMVGLAPVNRLAHAAEDLVGQLRDGVRGADGAIVDALLAALDCLRDMLKQARARTPVTIDPSAVVRRLRDPAGAPDVAPPSPPTGQPAPTAATAERVESAEAKRQTIRVDFDKLDRLLNLVGELVLGRDGLRGAIGALSSVTGELSGER